MINDTAYFLQVTKKLREHLSDLEAMESTISERDRLRAEYGSVKFHPYREELLIIRDYVSFVNILNQKNIPHRYVNREEQYAQEIKNESISKKRTEELERLVEKLTL